MKQDFLTQINNKKNRIKNKLGKHKPFRSDFHINHTHKCIYIKNPKVGSRTIMKMMGTLSKVEDQIIKGDGLNIRRLSTRGWGLHTYIIKDWHITHEVRDWLTLKEREEYFIFSFVRNPFERIVSAFYNKIVDDKYGLFLNIMNLDSWKEVIGQEVENTPECFKAFIQNFLFKKHPSNFNNHFTPQHLFINTPYTNNPFIGKLETFTEDWQTVTDHCHLNHSLPEQNSSNKNSYESYYSDRETVNLVYNCYKKDIDLYGYKNIYQGLCQKTKDT